MAKKENEATYILDSKKGLPNKLLQADGTTTDMLGNVVVNGDYSWEAKPALPNKWLNPDGTYSTLNEIIASVVDTGIYVIVDELPAEGDPQKIYLVPDGKGGFVEYHWTGTKWDPVGMVEFDISKYSTTQEMMNAIEAAGVLTLNSAKTYAEGQASTAETNANAYTKDKFDEAASYAEQEAYLAEESAKHYAEGMADTAETNAKAYTNAQLIEYIKNTDYAVGGKGGIIITSGTYGTVGNASTGVLSASIRSYENYQEAVSGSFISKGTLENVITGKQLVNQTYVDNIVGDVESILETLDVGGGVE